MTQTNRKPSAELFSRAFFHAPVPMALCTVPDGRFIEVNESFLRFLGLERNAVVGRTDQSLGFWIDASARERWWRLFGERGAMREAECRVRGCTGETRTVLLSAESIASEARSCALITLVDITDRMLRQAQAHKAQKLEALGQLAAGFAHDFNNILAIVQGYTGLLMAEPGLDHQANQALKEVAKATERAAHLTRQLLMLSRKQYARLKPLNLNELIQRLGTMLHRLLGDKTVLQLQLGPEMPLVRADAGMFEQLLANLALNARDAMPRGGQLRIATQSIELTEAEAARRPEARPGRFVHLVVEDNGCGMDATTLNRIFEPFFTTKEVGKGAGLGLATVYGIVRQHQGWIEVGSQIGHGTSFQIYLPAEAARAETTTEALPPTRAAEGRETILVVEDEISLSTLVRGILERYGYRVLSAATGSEALRIWEEHAGSIDLLLTDLVMPGGMSGADVAEKLRAQKPSLRIIYTSGYSADLMSDTIKELTDGVNFLQKPYRPHLLAQTVRNCLDGLALTPVAMVPAITG